MLSKYQSKINVGVSLGVFLIFGSSGLVKSPLRFVSGFATLMTGWALLLYGCASYAKAKGHSEWYGLLAVFFVPGMVVLTLLKDKYKGGRAWTMTKDGTVTLSGLPDRLPTLDGGNCGQRRLGDIAPVCIDGEKGLSHRASN
jgi:hypothetical protein